MIRRWFAAALLSAGLLGLGGCGGPAGPYRVVITEPSGNIDTSSEQLLVHWSCDPTADPAGIATGMPDGGWTDVLGEAGKVELHTEANCPPDTVLTVLADAAATSSTPELRPTTLRCQLFAADGSQVADEASTRAPDTADPVCRVSVP